MNTTPAAPAVQHIPIAAIRFDSATQIRVGISHETVVAYAERMKAGDCFPPVFLYQDGDTYYIGDGWHRLLAAQNNDAVTVPAEVCPGGRREAIKHALVANATHGLPRSSADKRRAVGVALREFANLSDAELARMCAVSDKTIAAVRSTLGNSERPATRTDTLGRQQPASRKRAIAMQAEQPKPEAPSIGGPLAEIEEDAKREEVIGSPSSLVHLTARVTAGIATYNRVCEALRAVRDLHLYRSTHATFEDYCAERWGIRNVHEYLELGAQTFRQSN